MKEITVTLYSYEFEILTDVIENELNTAEAHWKHAASAQQLAEIKEKILKQTTN